MVLCSVDGDRSLDLLYSWLAVMHTHLNHFALSLSPSRVRGRRAACFAAVGELPHPRSDCDRAIHGGRLSASPSHAVNQTQRVRHHPRLLGIRHADRRNAAVGLERHRRSKTSDEPRRRAAAAG